MCKRGPPEATSALMFSSGGFQPRSRRLAIAPSSRARTASGPPCLWRRNRSRNAIGSEAFGRCYADVPNHAPALGRGDFAIQRLDRAVNLGHRTIVDRLAVIADTGHARGTLRCEGLAAGAQVCDCRHCSPHVTRPHGPAPHRRARGRRAGRIVCRSIRCYRQLPLHLCPSRFRPTIRPCDPGGSARIDPAIQRLVALAQLLPFELGEAALVLDRDQLFGGHLLEPFAVQPSREMHRSRRERCTRSDLFRRRALLTQEAIGLGLEGRGGH
jgi:hypothetical protein